VKPPPKKPCRACPFRRKSLPGYLGEHDVEEFVGRYRSDSIMECHKTVDYERDDKTHLEQIADGDVAHCAGALILAANECKLSRDPQRPRMEPDRETVFANWREMRAHHDTPTHRSFISSMRQGYGLPPRWTDTEPGE